MIVKDIGDVIKKIINKKKFEFKKLALNNIEKALSFSKNNNYHPSLSVLNYVCKNKFLEFKSTFVERMEHSHLIYLAYSFEDTALMNGGRTTYDIQCEYWQDYIKKCNAFVNKLKSVDPNYKCEILFQDKEFNLTKQVLPELRNIQFFAKQRTRAEIFKGKRGINELYTNLLKSNGKEYNTFGGGSQVTYDVMGETWWRNLHAKRIDKKIPSRQIFDASIKNYAKQLNKLPLTKVKLLPQEFEQLQETVIIGGMVGIAIFTQNPYGILIQDQVVADGYRKQFEILWKNSD